MAAWVHDEGIAQGHRARQEDHYGVCELPPTLGAGDLLLVLADGMGGERGGARASTLAVRSFTTTYNRVCAATIPERLAQTLTEVNAQMKQEVATDPEALNGMGCTLLAVVLAEDGLYWVSVGDSPLWLWRRGRLHRLNQDHAYRSVLARQVSAGQISADFAARHPDRNALMSAVTGDSLDLIDLSQHAYALWNNDQILLASDGVLTLDEWEITTILTHRPADETPCPALLAAIDAHRRPQQDNTTLVWARSADCLPDEPWWHRWRALLGTG